MKQDRFPVLRNIILNNLFVFKSILKHKQDILERTYDGFSSFKFHGYKEAAEAENYQIYN
jgi:hypothetical protein